MLEQRVFSLRVQCGGGFVEDQQQWLIAHKTTRQWRRACATS
jgi:hypothetical protein